MLVSASNTDTSESESDDSDNKIGASFDEAGTAIVKIDDISLSFGCNVNAKNTTQNLNNIALFRRESESDVIVNRLSLNASMKHSKKEWDLMCQVKSMQFQVFRHFDEIRYQKGQRTANTVVKISQSSFEQFYFHPQHKFSICLMNIPHHLCFIFGFIFVSFP